MTLSIAGHCARTGQLGVAAAMATAGVSHLIAHLRAGVGAVATQAMINPYLAYDAFEELARERNADQALRVVMANDPGRHLRQCAIVDAGGGASAWTGEDTTAWAGDLTAEGVAVQGNRLGGAGTLKRMLAHFSETPDLPLPERLLEALEAVEGADLDELGLTSAALVVVGTEPYPLYDVRVERSTRPLEELRDLLGHVTSTVVPRIAKLPTREDPLGQLARESSDGLG